MSDQIEKALREIEDALRKAWQNNRCLTCPLGELAAIAAATRVFYMENRGKGHGVTDGASVTGNHTHRGWGTV